MFEKLSKSISSRPRISHETIKFGPWPDGLVTEYEPEQMKASQLYESLNMILVGPGIQRTRDGSTLACSGCTGSVVAVDDIKIGGTWYTIISDTDNKLYWNNSGTATAIATLEGEPHFCGFMGFLIIFDGSYIKAWDGTDLFMLYDNGIGPTQPYQVTHRADTPTTDKPLGNGTITAVELAFTTQAWDSGYTIPTTMVYAQLQKVGSPTGTITAKIKTAGGVEMASSDITTPAENILTDSAGGEYEAIFDLNTDITTEMSPNTSYKVVLEYSGGDASNYINVKAVDASTPILSVKPGRPPKAVFGIVHQDRLHCIEGESGDNPSYRWYCAAGNHLDWSTADGGGYTPVVDSSSTNYAIGGIASWNDSLWFFGTPRQPFLGKQTGASPAEWAINKTMQRVSGHYKSIVVTPDNIVFLHPSGIDMIAAVDVSSDIAAESQSDSIRRTIQRHFSDGAVAGYDPEWGLYVLQLEGSNDAVVINSRGKSVRYQGRKYAAFSPVTRWQFAFSGTPTAFGNGDGLMYIGTDDGKVYRMDKGTVLDDGADITYKTITSSISTKFGQAQAYRISGRLFSSAGATLKIKFYRNYSRSVYDEIPIGLSVISNTLTMDLNNILTADANFLSVPDAFFDRENINFNFRNLMIGIEDINLYGGAMYISDITIDVKMIGGM